MSERIAVGGQLSYRTRLMERPKAEAFAACLRSNPRFSNVVLVKLDLR
jgi:hypothetical protein